MRTNGPEVLDQSPVALRSESPKFVGLGSELSRLSRLTRSIISGMSRHPVESAVGVVESAVGVFATLYFGYHVVRGINNYNANLAKEATQGHGNKNSLTFDPGPTDWIKQQLGIFGDVIPTGSVGVRIIEPVGVNVRYLPNKDLGIRVKTGQLEPYYRVLQFHGYDPNPTKQVSHFFKTTDNNIWAVTWSDPDKNNEGLRYLELFAIYHDGEWLADFIVDGQHTNGRVLFDLSAQAAKASK